jgi:hypothetical protein
VTSAAVDLGPDLDWVTVDRVMRGHELPLTRPEQEAVVLRLVGQGAPPTRAAVVAHMNYRNALALIAEHQQTCPGLQPGQTCPTCLRHTRIRLRACR